MNKQEVTVTVRKGDKKNRQHLLEVSKMGKKVDDHFLDVVDAHRKDSIAQLGIQFTKLTSVNAARAKAIGRRLL